MKKKTIGKLLSFATAATLTAASVSSVYANAYIWIDGTMFETFGEFEMVEDYDNRGLMDPAGVPYETYNEYTKTIRRINENSVEYRFFNHRPNGADLEIHCDGSEETLQDIRSRINKVCPEAVVKISHDKSEPESPFFIDIDAYGYELWDVLSDEEHYAKQIKPEQAKQIRDSLMEIAEINRFDFHNSDYICIIGCMKFPAIYDIDVNELELLETYLAENELDFTVEKKFWKTTENGDLYEVKLERTTDMSVLEAYEALDLFAIKEGIRPIPSVIYTANGSSPGDYVLDVSGSVDGDANEDSELTIADAVLIMQSLSNPDKYALTTQGEFNADVTGDGDGVTLGDALTVQEILLGK